MSDPGELRRRVQEALQAGEFPDRPPLKIWAGSGSGAQCAVCGRTVTRHEIEYELQFAANGVDAPERSHRFHVRCFAAWEAETEYAQAAPPVAAAAAASIEGCPYQSPYQSPQPPPSVDRRADCDQLPTPA